LTGATEGQNAGRVQRLSCADPGRLYRPVASSYAGRVRAASKPGARFISPAHHVR
jgi:hypothetical protein